jgi:hypothetical protein
MCGGWCWGRKEWGLESYSKVHRVTSVREDEHKWGTSF